MTSDILSRWACINYLWMISDFDYDAGEDCCYPSVKTAVTGEFLENDPSHKLASLSPAVPVSHQPRPAFCWLCKKNKKHEYSLSDHTTPTLELDLHFGLGCTPVKYCVCTFDSGNAIMLMGLLTQHNVQYNHLYGGPHYKRCLQNHFLVCWHSSTRTSYSALPSIAIYTDNVSLSVRHLDHVLLTAYSSTEHVTWKSPLLRCKQSTRCDQDVQRTSKHCQ